MRCLVVFVLLLGSCGTKQPDSAQDVESELCDGNIYQLIAADKTHVSDTSYLLLTLDCNKSQMKLTQVVGGQQIKDQTTDIKLSVPEGVITFLNEGGDVDIKQMNTSLLGAETIYFYIPASGILKISTDEEELVFQKFHLRSQE